jgi:lipopolysaccharide export LptBFGC system permease protein LptF
MATRPTSFTEDNSSETFRRNGGSTIELLRRLMDELTLLFRQEMALATAELTHALSKLTSAVTAIATGGAVAFAGFLVLLAAAVLGLANVVAPWLAALIVGGVVTAVGIALLLAGRKKLDPAELKPRLSPESIRRDKEILTRSAS